MSFISQDIAEIIQNLTTADRTHTYKTNQAAVRAHQKRFLTKPNRLSRANPDLNSHALAWLTSASVALRFREDEQRSGRDICA